MENLKKRLATFLAEVSEWRWDDFVRSEIDPMHTTNDSMVFALIRACAMEDLKAIKTAVNRLDGKLSTPVQFKMPKVYFLYPNAKEKLPSIEGPSSANEIVVVKESELAELHPTKGFRETMDRMGEFPRETPLAIIGAQEQIERHVRKAGLMPTMVPRVKSVVAAHLLKMAQERNIDALNEVFDQLDGKLVETIEVVGEDLEILCFDEVAPPGAYLNSEGVYQIEASGPQEMWNKHLAPKKAIKPIIVEGD